MFAKCTADVLVYGGEAGGGKTWAVVTQPLRHVHNRHFRGAIFRRTEPEITGEGGLWDSACDMYPQFKARMREANLDCTFPSGARIGFRTLQYESSIYQHQSKEYCYLALDEATHFTRKQILYMFSRNRSKSGIPSYIRMTCNPDPDSFIAELIDWHIDDDGYAIPERDGIVRWLVIDDLDIHFYDTFEEATAAWPERDPETDFLTFTFIHASLDDNPALLKKDPKYRAKLMMLPKIERDRLLGGNWKSKAGSIIDTSQLGRYRIAGRRYQCTVANEFYDVPFDACQRFSTTDTAGTSKEKAAEQRGDPPSNSATAVFDYWQDKDLLFLAHLWAAQVGWLDLKTITPETLLTWNVDRAYIENAHFGQALADEITGTQVELIGPMIPGMGKKGAAVGSAAASGAKLDRAIASKLLSRIEAGKFLIPHHDDAPPWLKPFLSELSSWTGLPKETSDRIDVCSYGSFVAVNLSVSWGGVVS